ncbi:hypothetical protein FOL01_1289 [Weissella jogaejeotgali]|uniref:SHOCT domain-containing protein n=1 Tax=Weissella jogaejeotgali TaxID=1631871 RepID=A0A1L6RCC4_9LACO|nr:SHOCT domain-containing protein [Weissella jogaejeotgali]APS42148.1 hypothetical protein FOL01_1289 [Weissella jogaejeotgali]
MKYDDLKSLKELLDENLITEEEYKVQKAHILGLPVKSEKDDGGEGTKDNESISSETNIPKLDSVENLGTKSSSNDNTSHQPLETASDEEEVTAKKHPIADDEIANNQIISRVESHNKGHFKNVCLIILTCIIVFIIGCVLGYYIFK